MDKEEECLNELLHCIRKYEEENSNKQEDIIKREAWLCMVIFTTKFIF